MTASLLSKRLDEPGREEYLNKGEDPILAVVLIVFSHKHFPPHPVLYFLGVQFALLHSKKARSSRIYATRCATTTIGVEEAQTMVANGRYGGEPLPYGQRDRKRPGDDFGHTGDRKRINYNNNNNNYKQERPPRSKDPMLHLATSPKGLPEYPVHQSPSSASPGSNASARVGELRSKYHLSIRILDLLALLRTTP